MKSVFLTIFILIGYSNVYCQLNFIENGMKTHYWGISLAYSTTDLGIDRHEMTSNNDSIFSIDSKMAPGAHLGLIGNWQFNRYFDLRAIPNMTFGEKVVQYQTDEGIVENRYSSNYLSLPILLRFKSEPVQDLRIFIISGIKYDYNIVNQDQLKVNPDWVRLKKHGLSAEYGIGFQFFFPYFIFSPEIKFSHSLFNMLDQGQSPLNNTLLKGVYPRALTISINFEG